ncbi:MAG: FeoB-associated Cys-rich membrane protein [Oscillospiraceae bacterium]|nr:FeoB-associated Cys-rich membrane protein [Oscillospiraceae bacterium]MBR0450660.1 FeoB-associated Cys-rich membrane protein [Oscillospiraceae bacterium]
MNLLDIIIISVIVVALFFALRSSFLKRKNGSCCSDCSACGFSSSCDRRVSKQ